MHTYIHTYMWYMHTVATVMREIKMFNVTLEHIREISKYLSIYSLLLYVYMLNMLYVHVRLPVTVILVTRLNFLNIFFTATYDSRQREKLQSRKALFLRLTRKSQNIDTYTKNASPSAPLRPLLLFLLQCTLCCNRG